MCSALEIVETCSYESNALSAASKLQRKQKFRFMYLQSIVLWLFVIWRTSDGGGLKVKALNELCNVESSSLIPSNGDQELKIYGVQNLACSYCATVNLRLLHGNQPYDFWLCNKI